MLVADRRPDLVLCKENKTGIQAQSNTPVRFLPTSSPAFVVPAKSVRTAIPENLGNSGHGGGRHDHRCDADVVNLQWGTRGNAFDDRTSCALTNRLFSFGPYMRYLGVLRSPSTTRMTEPCGIVGAGATQGTLAIQVIGALLWILTLELETPAPRTNKSLYLVRPAVWWLSSGRGALLWALGLLASVIPSFSFWLLGPGHWTCGFEVFLG